MEKKTIIDCGIGIFKYSIPDENLLLQQMMDALEEKIRNTSPQVVLQLLS